MNYHTNVSRHDFITNSKVRLEIGNILASTSITDFNNVRGISDTFETLTRKPGETNLELQNRSTTTIQRTVPIIKSLVDTSKDLREISTSLHRVLSNVVGAVLLTSVDDFTMATNTSTNNTTFFEDAKANSIGNTFQTVDEINDVLLQQVLAGDKSTVIKTENYEIKLAKRRVEDFVMQNKWKMASFPVTFQDAMDLVENTKFTELSVLGLTVTDLSKTPRNLYGTSAEEINSNILRVNLKDSLGEPVAMRNIGVNIFVKSQPRDDIPEQFSVIHTLKSWNSLKIHRFNRSSPEAALVLILRVIDPNLSLRVFLSAGRRPTLENFEFKAEFSGNNLTSGRLPYTWVLSREKLRNVTFPESKEYFLGLTWSERLGLVNKSYTLHVAWVKCLMLEEGGKTWTSGACEVGNLTSFERTHCVCRLGEDGNSSESGRDSHHVRRRRRSAEFGGKRNFKIAVGASIFPAPNKIDFNYVFDADVRSNPLSLIAVSTVFGIYLILLVYARRRDRKDSEKIGVTSLPSNKSSHKYLYEVTIYTGSVYDAGTSAHVSIVLNGAEGDLGPKILYDPMRQCFQRSSIDTFLMSSRDLVGDVSYLQIWHDNTGLSPSWFLEKVIVRDLNEKKNYIFFNESWLAVETEQGQTKRLLFPACKDEITRFKRLFNSTISSNLKDRHLWFSLLSRPVNSRFTLVQRLSCCLSLMYTTMLANAMFYQKTGSSTPESSLTIGPFMFGLREVMVGIMSALVIVPLNAGIVWMFRNIEAKPSKGELAARKQTSKLWWFYEAFFCCFKSRRVSSNYIRMMTRNDPCSASMNSLQDLDVPIEISNDTIKLSKKSKASSSTIQLPYWYIYIVWLLVCLTSVISAFFVVLYGLQFGKVKSSQWLSSMTVSFVQDVLINEPLKVFAIAIVVALIIKKPQNSESKEHGRMVDRHFLQNTGDIDPKEDYDNDAIDFKPPDKKDLEIARIKKLKEIRTGSLLKELCLYVLFLLCLSVVTYKNRNPMSFQVQKTMRHLLLGRSGVTVSFGQISNMNDFLIWTNATFLKALFSASYNTKLSSSNDSNIVFGNFYLVGCVRLYQTQETSASSNSTDTPLFLEISSNSTGSSETNHFTKIRNWLNTQAREINIKFNVYNPSLDLFCLAKLTVEVLPTNGMKSHAKFVVTKLFALSGIVDAFSFTSRVFIVLFFLIFTYREMKQVYRLKKKYFRNIWNILQGLLMLVIFSSIIVFFIRLVMIEELFGTRESNHGRFVDFDSVVFVDKILGNLVAFVVFLSWLRVIKFLRFNQRLSFLQDTLGKVGKPLTTYSVVFLTVFFAYVHSGYLLFSRELKDFRDLKTTFTSLCSLLMGHFDFPLLQNSNRVIGPIFVFTALFFGGFIIINFLIVLILESFLAVKAAAASRANQYELLDYVKKLIRNWFGTSGSQPQNPHQNLSRGKPVRCLNPGDKTLGDKYLGQKTRVKEQKSQLETRITKYESNLATLEKSVSVLMTSLECVCEEDWYEEVILYRLILKSLGLANYDWLDYVSDLENLDDISIILLRNELYEAVEKYSQEYTIDCAQNPGGQVSKQTFSVFDLNFEEESF